MPFLPPFPRRLFFGALLAVLCARARGAEFFVAPSGSPSGDGSTESPWDLQTALAHPTSVSPGDTIWLRAGIYRGTYTSHLTGTSDSPIVVREYPGERATVDGGNSGMTNILSVSGSYTWYWGFEITSSDLGRVSAEAGSNPTDIGRGGGVAIVQSPETGAGLKFINLIVHDAAGGFGLWKEAVGAEVYGCLVYYNGWKGTDRGHGHGFYVQNLDGTKQITDNLVFENFDHGLQAYGSGAASLDNIEIRGNTFFDNGLAPAYSGNVLVGGGSVAENPRVVDNVLYFPDESGQNLDVGYFPYGAGATNGIVTGNLLINGELPNFSPLDDGLVVTGNAFYVAFSEQLQSLFPSNLYADSPPETPQVILRPNRYEPGRANITIINEGKDASVSVDLSSVLTEGSNYEIRDAQDFFGPAVATGIYDGLSVTFDLAPHPAKSAVGFPALTSLDTVMRVFVVLSSAPATVSPPAPDRPVGVPRLPRSIPD